MVERVSIHYLGFIQVHSPTPEHELVRFVFYGSLDSPPEQAHSLYVTNALDANKHYFDIPVYFDMMEQNNMMTFVKVS